MSNCGPQGEDLGSLPHRERSRRDLLSALSPIEFCLTGLSHSMLFAQFRTLAMGSKDLKDYLFQAVLS